VSRTWRQKNGRHEGEETRGLLLRDDKDIERKDVIKPKFPAKRVW
jgi:hypothetical protein